MCHFGVNFVFRVGVFCLDRLLGLCSHCPPLSDVSILNRAPPRLWTSAARYQTPDQGSAVQGSYHDVFALQYNISFCWLLKRFEQPKKLMLHCKTKTT